MKLKFDSVLLDIEGKPLKDGDNELKLSTVTCGAMLAVELVVPGSTTPDPASARAVAAPSPEAPPVTTAAIEESSCMNRPLSKLN